MAQTRQFQMTIAIEYLASDGVAGEVVNEYRNNICLLMAIPGEAVLCFQQLLRSCSLAAFYFWYLQLNLCEREERKRKQGCSFLFRFMIG